MMENDETVNTQKEMPKGSQAHPSEEENKLSLEIASENFDPVRLLYADNVKVCEKTPKVQYQNLAAFETALKNFGIWELNKRKKEKSKDVHSGKPTTSKASDNPFKNTDGISDRKFLPHQIAVPSKPSNKTSNRHMRNLFNLMETVLGPLALLKKCVLEKVPCRILVRNEHGVRGTITGQLICFDKYMNLMLEDVVEKYHRRKYKYGENNICSAGEDCSDRLRNLGIQLPEQKVRSLNRKNCEITRYLKHLLIRGEQVVLVSIIENRSI